MTRDPVRRASIARFNIQGFPRVGMAEPSPDQLSAVVGDDLGDLGHGFLLVAERLNSLLRQLQ